MDDLSSQSGTDNNCHLTDNNGQLSDNNGQKSPAPEWRAAFCSAGCQGQECTCQQQREGLPKALVEGIKNIEQALGMPIVLLLQADDDSNGVISMEMYERFFERRLDANRGARVALLIHSPGGDPAAAYKLARFLKESFGSYIALVPRYAKSAATLLSLGAERIILDPHAELGPLDMQVGDLDSEQNGSALNHVQALERLSAFALDAFDRAVLLMTRRTGKKIGTVLPYALDFASSMVKPLLGNIDVVKYTEMSRILKVGEAYATRLLEPRYGSRISQQIAIKLVSDYPEHGFVIDYQEARKVGLSVELPDERIAKGFETIMESMGKVSAYGTLIEMK